MLPYNRKLKKRSQTLRKNSTKAEIMLWRFLRKKRLDNYQWYRQKPLDNFIVDFYCPKRKLIVELDGARHFTEAGRIYDQERDDILNGLGLRVLRFGNEEIFGNLESVLNKIRG